MKHRPRSRSCFRRRRPAPPQPTRSQIAQSLRRLRTLTFLEFDLAKATNDVDRQKNVRAQKALFEHLLSHMGEPYE